MYQNFIIPYLYKAQHVSGDIPSIIRSLKLHWQLLVFHTWKVVGRVVGGRFQAHCAWQHPPTTRPTTFHVWKTRGCQCSFRLQVMCSALSHTVPDNIHQLHVQQPSTYETPEAASAVLGSWWRAVCKHGIVKLLCLTTSTNYTSNNLPRMKNQRLPVQF